MIHLMMFWCPFRSLTVLVPIYCHCMKKSNQYSSSKYLIFSSFMEKKSSIKMVWTSGWVNSDWIFIIWMNCFFSWTHPLSGIIETCLWVNILIQSHFRKSKRLWNASLVSSVNVLVSSSILVIVPKLTLLSPPSL